MTKTTTKKTSKVKVAASTTSKGTQVEIGEMIAKIKEQAGGTIFSVGFMKRTTGEFRHMVCRLGVRKHLKGGEQGYDPISKGLLTVYDVINRGYRTIPLENLLWVKIKGQLWTKKKLVA